MKGVGFAHQDSQGLYHQILHLQLPQRSCDALLAVLKCEGTFKYVNEDLRPFPDARKFAERVGSSCLILLEQCVGGPKSSGKGSRGYLQDMVRERANFARRNCSHNQLAKEILGVFSFFLETLNDGFVNAPSNTWRFSPNDLRETFRTLATEIEKSLTRFCEVAGNTVDEPLEPLMADLTLTEPNPSGPNPNDWRCYKCKMMGHFASDCVSVSKSNDSCYRCGEVGHFARECPTRQVRRHQDFWQKQKCYKCKQLRVYQDDPSHGWY